MPVSVHRKGRGVKKVASATVANDALKDSPDGLDVLTGTAGYIDIVDRVYFQYPNDVTAWDVGLEINGIMEAGTPRQVFRIDEAGAEGPTDLAAVFDWDNPNPPTGFIYGYVELPNAVIDGIEDTVVFLGYDGTDANNYHSTGATSMQVTVVYRQIAKSLYQQNLV